MKNRSGVFLLCITLVTSVGISAEETDQKNIRQLATNWLIENTSFIRCDDEHFIYGVGYIDGSYMERIFYVEGGGAKPGLSVQFRDAKQAVLSDSGEFGPVPFVLEMNAPRTRHATLENKKWVPGDDWETAIRFKYTSWFGLISRKAGQWAVDWQGYRRPMLPESLTGHVDEACSLFSGQ
jgi:hypothetical protein